MKSRSFDLQSVFGLLLCIWLSTPLAGSVFSSCHTCFETILASQSQRSSPSNGPPQSIPDYLLPGFTMNGAIQVENYFVDDSNRSFGFHFKFNAKSMLHMLM